MNILHTISAKILIAFLCPTLSILAQSGDDELVNIKELIPDIVLDLKYNTEDNFVTTFSGSGQKLYTTDECLVSMAVAKRLILVQDSLRAMGRGLKMFDGYRPRTVQFVMWEYVGEPYVANPNTGSRHNRGAAVDVGLVQLSSSKELPMPTPFDYFGPEASHDYTHPDSTKDANRILLLDVMTRIGGFNSYSVEWWHYEYPPAVSYPLRDFQLK